MEPQRHQQRTQQLFQARGDPIADEWYLSDPVPSVDSWEFRRGERIDPPSEIRLEIKDPGVRLDITIRGGALIVVAEWVGALVEELAPDDVQRIPVRVGDLPQRYELLHVLARIDCIDRDLTVAFAQPPGETGTLASLAPFIDFDNLYNHVMPGDMVLKNDSIVRPRIFRVPRWDLWPVVSSDIKDALEERGATGATFVLASRP